MCVNYVHYYPRAQVQQAGVEVHLVHLVHRAQVEVCKSTISPSSLDSYFPSLVEREDQPLQGLEGVADR